MGWMRRMVGDRIREQTGATAVEYAVMVALIALVIFAAVGAIGLNLEAVFSDSDLRTALSS